MDHFYKDIFGFFNFQDVYSEVVELAKDGGHFLEIGSFFGCSTVYMAVEIINSGKNIKFDSVDKWNFNWNLNEKNVNVFEEYLKNIEPVRHIVNPIRGFSVEVSKQYENESLDFIFIDGDHEYEGVKNDLIHWCPKVKRGGIIAGHDYVEGYDGVIKAVDDSFGKNNVIPRMWSWWVNKK